MPPADLTAGAAVSGSIQFARYAHGPNALGYCGPGGAAALARAACGADDPAAVRAAAERFSGAWPYQLTIAAACDRDPMEPDVVRGYWIGNELTDALDRAAFAEALLECLRSRAGHYWPHLSADLAPEVTPSHAFHVLGVYPWSRMLDAGRPEPLHVLESCRIGWGTVLAVGTDHLTVSSRPLTYADGRLGLGPEQTRQVAYRVAGAPFVAEPEVGETLALHWDFACDRLTLAEVDRLDAALRHQVEFVNRRGTS